MNCKPSHLEHKRFNASTTPESALYSNDTPRTLFSRRNAAGLCSCLSFQFEMSLAGRPPRTQLPPLRRLFCRPKRTRPAADGALTFALACRSFPQASFHVPYAHVPYAPQLLGGCGLRIPRVVIAESRSPPQQRLCPFPLRPLPARAASAPAATSPPTAPAHAARRTNSRHGGPTRIDARPPPISSSALPLPHAEDKQAQFPRVRRDRKEIGLPAAQLKAATVSAADRQHH